MANVSEQVPIWCKFGWHTWSQWVDCVNVICGHAWNGQQKRCIHCNMWKKRQLLVYAPNIPNEIGQQKVGEQP